jgi:hypothetical protein
MLPDKTQMTSENTMEQQRQLVGHIHKQILEYKNLIYVFEEKLAAEKKVLQEMCLNETGHQYDAESDGDYHKPGYYYTCTSCGYWTNIRPSDTSKVTYRR